MLVKICGNVFPEESLAVASCRPDYMGWIFSARSKRRISADLAAQLIQEIRSTFPIIQHVALFTDEDVLQIHQTVHRVKPDIIQMVAGVGRIDSLRRIIDGELPVIPAIRVQYKISNEDFAKYGKIPFAILDTYREDSLGGTGEMLDRRMIENVSRPFFLAGGLNPGNVKQALSETKAIGADVSSGVEDKTPGRKNLEKVKEFISEVKSL